MGDRYISVNDAAVMWGVCYVRARQIIVVESKVASERVGGHLVVLRADAERHKRERDQRRAKRSRRTSNHAAV